MTGFVCLVDKFGLYFRGDREFWRVVIRGVVWLGVFVF